MLTVIYLIIIIVLVIIAVNIIKWIISKRINNIVKEGGNSSGIVKLGKNFKKIVNSELYEILVTKLDNEFYETLRKNAGVISFPYKRLFLKSDDMGMFNRLVDYNKTKIVKYNYNEKFHNYFVSERSKRNKLDVKFDGKYLAVDVGDSYSVDVLTDLFQEEQRIKCNVIGKMSPLQYWNVNMVNLCKELNISGRKINSENLRELLYEKCQECTQFKATYALFMYGKFKATRILDFSAGWGDRLLAALASKYVVRYVGYDPNVELKKGHDEMINKYNVDVDKDIRVIYEPFETAKIEGRFNLVFTSPPYFNLEIYKGDNQSINSFKTYDQWLHKFLFVSLMKAWDVLDVNGYMIIHIANIKIYDGGKFMYANIIEDMNNYLCEELKNGVFMGSLGIIGRTKGVDKVRPAWVWKKVNV